MHSKGMCGHTMAAGTFIAWNRSGRRWWRWVRGGSGGSSPSWNYKEHLIRISSGKDVAQVLLFAFILRRRPVGLRLLLRLLPFALDEHADSVFLHEVARVRWVADILEGLRRFLSSLLQQDLFASRVLRRTQDQCTTIYSLSTVVSLLISYQIRKFEFDLINAKSTFKCHYNPNMVIGELFDYNRNLRRVASWISTKKNRKCSAQQKLIGASCELNERTEFFHGDLELWTFGEQDYALNGTMSFRLGEYFDPAMTRQSDFHCFHVSRFRCLLTSFRNCVTS